jgi:Ca-activated chloride channel homolog
MNEFRFANQEYLWALLALPVLWLFLRKVSKDGRQKLLRFMADANLEQLLLSRGTLRERGKKGAFWAGLALLILAFARPQANPTVEEVQSSGLDIYVLLDVSRSMDVEDVAPSRLKKAKKTIQHLASRLNGDRLGIIAYANSAVLVSPLTSDYSIIDSYLKNVDSSLIPSQGTNVGGALEVARTAMERGAKSFGSEESRTNIFVVMSDGEDYGESDLSIVDEIRKSGGLVFSIAFGTERGAPIPLRDEKGELRGYKTDSAKNAVVSGMKPKVLQEVASRGGGHFYFSTLEETEVQDLLARVSDAQRGSLTTIRTTVYEEWFLLFLAPALLLLIFSYVPVRSLTFYRYKLKKKAPSALALAISLFLPVSYASAHPLEFFWTEEKRASARSQELEKQKKFAEAVDTLKGLQAENPDSQELAYNIGTHLLQDQKYGPGREQLSRLRSADDHVRALSLFNIGGSYALEGKKEDARAAYAELIQFLSAKTKPTEEESKLLEQTKQNVARLADPSQQPKPQPDKSQSEQKQQEKGSPGSDGEQKKENKEEPGDKSKQDKSEGKDDKSSGEKKEQKKDGQDQKENKEGKGQDDQAKEEGSRLPPKGHQRPFKERDNMGEEDAKQILGALKERETSIQKKFLKEQVKGGKVKVDDAAKDW